MRTTRAHLFPGNRTLRTLSLLLSACLVVLSFALMPRQAHAAVSISETTVPTAASGPFDIALGPDGALWFTEYFASKIGRCTVGGAVTNEYALPAGSTPSCITAGPDGNLWFTEFGRNRIGRITTSGVINEFPLPTAGGFPWDITVGPDGNLWFTEIVGSRIGRCTTSGVITEFPVTGGNGPRGITAGPDGNLWFVEQNSNAVSRMTTSGALTRYPIPTAASSPWGITVGPDGNLWFTESAGNRIGRCTTSGVINEFPLPNAASEPIGILAGPDGALWFAQRQGNRIGRCSTSGIITEDNVPTAASQPMELAVAPDGSVWFGETAAGKLGRAEGYETPTWYLAEGSTAWGFSTYITLTNPNWAAVHAVVSYMPTGGALFVQMLTLPGDSQVTITNDNLLVAMGGPRDFSTRVECAEGLQIAVDRTMEWTGPGATASEGHNSIGVTSPARKWYLAEGSSKWGFECYLCIQNPTSYAATCQVTYMIEGEGPQTFAKTVAANSRDTFSMADDIGAKDASIQVVSNVPVIPERAMYRNNRREGHDSIGTPVPALRYYLAEGTTAWNFTTYLVVQNPNPQPVDVTVTYQTAGGAFPQAPFQMGPNSRKTINVNQVMPNVDLSTLVEGTLPIIAERAMYLPSASGEICHGSIGFTATHRVFLLPDGQTTDGRETYTVVQNPNGVPVDIRIVYLMQNGTGIAMFDYSVPANSRVTYPMPVIGRCSTVIATLSGEKMMVERAMYWNNRQAATNTIGGFTD